MERTVEQTDGTSRERIIAAARREFAASGFAGARLQQIAAASDLRHSTLIYHFSSKEQLYAAVIESVVADWAEETRTAISTGLRGIDQVAALVEAGFGLFERNPDFVRIVRRESLEDGGRLEEAMAEFLRPFLDDAVTFLREEVAAGRLRPHDPFQLMHVCWATSLSTFSDTRFLDRLLDEDALAPERLARHRDGLVALLRAALEP